MSQDEILIMLYKNGGWMRYNDIRNQYRDNHKWKFRSSGTTPTKVKQLEKYGRLMRYEVDGRVYYRLTELGVRESERILGINK